MRKTTSILFLCTLMSFSNIRAQETEMGIFNHLAAGASVGTTGLSFNMATPVSKYLAVNASIDWMPDFHRTDNIQYYLYQDLTEYGLGKWDSGTRELTMKGGTGRVQGAVVFNVYPFANADFYVAAGAYFGGNKVLDMNGFSDKLVDDINDIKHLYGRVADYYQTIGKETPQIPADYAEMMQSKGYVNAYIETNAFRPYLGIGYGRVVPTSRLAFNCELGIQFSGKYKLASDNCSDAVLSILGIEHKYADTLDDLNKLKCYPVLKLRLAGRIF